MDVIVIVISEANKWWLWHSLRLNAEVVAKAWQIFGSLIVGVKIILQVVILLFYVSYKKNMSKINPVVALH